MLISWFGGLVCCVGVHFASGLQRCVRRHKRPAQYVPQRSGGGLVLCVVWCRLAVSPGWPECISSPCAALGEQFLYSRNLSQDFVRMRTIKSTKYIIRWDVFAYITQWNMFGMNQANSLSRQNRNWQPCLNVISCHEVIKILAVAGKITNFHAVWSFSLFTFLVLAVVGNYCSRDIQECWLAGYGQGRRCPPVFDRALAPPDNVLIGKWRPYRVS